MLICISLNCKDIDFFFLNTNDFDKEIEKCCTQISDIKNECIKEDIRTQKYSK